MLFEKMAGPSFFQHMLHAEGQHGPDVIVVQGIKHGLALPPEADEVRRLQNAQLAADCVRFSSRAMSHTHSSLSKST